MKIRNTWLTVTVLLGLLLSGMASAQEWRLNVKNADINEFVEQVAEITGKTFVLDPRLKGNVTIISSTPMHADAVYELFLQVLRSHGFTASPSGDVIRIQQTALGKQSPGAESMRGEISAGELITKVIPAQNVASSELVKILRPLVPQYGHIAPIDQPNVVIITDHVDNIERLTRMIQQIDVSNDDIVQVLNLKEAWVGTVVATLEKLAPEQIGRNAKGPTRVQIIANERNNSMILRGRARPIAEVLKLVDQLDRPATTAGSVQVIRLKHADSKNVSEIVKGIVTSESAKKGDEGSQQPSIQADESLNAIVVRAEPGTMNEILDIVAKLDVRRSQVLIEAAIVEFNVTDNKKLGVEIGAADASGESIPFVSTALDGALRQLLGAIIPADATNAIESGDVNILRGVAAATSPTFAVAKIDGNAISFGAVVTALATNSDANLLSTPSLMTLDNQEAKIVVGNEVPFRTGSFTTQGDGASNPFTTVTREDVGLQLTITPHVYDNTSIRLEIAQEITNVIDSPVGDSAFADVVTSKREIQTTVLANSNQTVVLGGLIQDNNTVSRKKVPLLGDIPGLGVLFRSKDAKRTKTNLLVFLRPVVIATVEATQAATDKKYSDVWEVEINSTPQAEIDRLFEGKLPDPTEN